MVRNTPLHPTSLLIVPQAQGQATEVLPPNSRFFDADQRIKNITSITVAAKPVTAPALVAPAPAPSAPASLSISDLLIASLLSQNGGLANLFQPAASSLVHPPATPAPQNRTAPPSPVKRHSVTVEKFCERYDIDDMDCVRLKDVGFRPGDVTETKLDDELKAAGFTLFSWKRIHFANQLFKADLAAGLFDGNLFDA